MDSLSLEERNARLVEALSAIYLHPNFHLLNGVKKKVENALKGAGTWTRN